MEMKNYTIYFDEAGRGPLAWPVFIWLVCPLKKLSREELEPFRDSKKLSESVREHHFELIENLQKDWKLIYSPAWMTAAEIDKYGMTNTLHCAILRWLIQISNQLFPNELWKRLTLPNPLSTKITTKYQIAYSDVLSFFSNLQSKWIHIKLILDWNRDFWLKKMFPFWEFETVIHGDDTIKEISMASIIAKVSRDRIMEKLPKKYDKYEFGKHKWYGTSEHKRLIEEYGPSDIHRKLFLKWIYPNHTIQKKLPNKF